MVILTQFTPVINDNDDSHPWARAASNDFEMLFSFALSPPGSHKRPRRLTNPWTIEQSSLACPSRILCDGAADVE